MVNKITKPHYHRFLDEAGDTTFYGKGRVPILGSEGVSKYFILGMLTINEPLQMARNKVIHLQNTITSDPYLFGIPSIHKRKSNSGYYLHAKNDIPEVRKMTFELIKSIDCKFEAVVGKKDYHVYEKKHNGNQAEFYADMLSNLLHENLNVFDKFVLNIASRSRCTTHSNLEKGLQKAMVVSIHKYPNHENQNIVKFNVQKPSNEPLINIVDYFLWSLQRKIERDEDRYFDFLSNQVNSITYLYYEEQA